MENDNSVVAGFKSMMDLEGTTMAHFLQMTPIQMKKMIVFSQVIFYGYNNMTHLNANDH